MIRGPLIAEDISKYWSTIKFGAIQVHAPKEMYREQYCTGLLKNLFMGDIQAWFVVSEEKIIKAVLMTKMVKDIGELPHLIIVSAYGYKPTTHEEKIETTKTLLEFAKKQGCSNSLSALTSNPMAANAMVKMGMTRTFEIYSVKED